MSQRSNLVMLLGRLADIIQLPIYWTEGTGRGQPVIRCNGKLRPGGLHLDFDVSMVGYRYVAMDDALLSMFRVGTKLYLFVINQFADGDSVWVLDASKLSEIPGGKRDAFPAGTTLENAKMVYGLGAIKKYSNTLRSKEWKEE